MKFTPICIALALLSPAAALRGNRRVQEGSDLPVESDMFLDAGDPTESPEDSNEAGTFFSSFNGGINYDVPLAPPPPTPAPTFSAEDQAAMVEAGTWEDANLDYEDAEHHKGGGGGSGKSGSKSRKYGTGTIPGDCGAFCQDYVEVCDSANAFFDGGPRGGDPGSRRLIEGDEPTLVRLGDSTFGAVDDCLKACAGYPRPYDPSTFRAIEPPAGGSLDSNSIGDTFWCRQTHLQVAKTAGDAFAAQVHCPAASPSGGGKCVNQGLGWNWAGDNPLTNPLTESPLNNLNATAWELIRNGADTGRHLGYCQLYFNDVVADCTNAGIDNAAFTAALGLIPISVEVIILSNNVGKSTSFFATAGEGLTIIEDNAFKNLFCPTCIRSVIIDQGNLATLSRGSFSGLTYLEQLSLNMQPIAALPTGMLDELLYLREFTVYNNNGQPGRLTDAGVPAALIFNNMFLERFVISGHPSLKNLPSTFFGNRDPMDLSIMQSIDLSNNGLIDGGFLPGTLNNMGQLEYLDLSQNDFQTAPAGWIVPSMRKLRFFSLYDNPIMTFSRDFFVNAVSLEVALLHDLTVIAPALGLFTNSPNLISYTISETAPSNL